MKTATVIIDGREPFVQLSLVNANLSGVALPEDMGRTQVPLPPGAYIAHFSTSAWEGEKSFLVLPDLEETLTISPDTLPQAMVESAAPLPRTVEFLPADAELAAEMSRGAAGSRYGGEGSLFLMLRRRLFDAAAGTCESAFDHPPWNEVSLLDADGRPVADLAETGFADPRRGVACAHVRLPPGSYILRIAAANRQMFVSQFLPVIPGRQTQVFLLDRGSSKPTTTEWVTAQLSVHFGRADTGFEATAAGLLAAEELIQVVASGRHPRVSPSVRQELFAADCPMLELAFWLSQAQPWTATPALEAEALRTLKDRLPGVADAVVLWQAARLEGSLDGGGNPDSGEWRQRLCDPPMLARTWDLALFAETRGAPGAAPDSRSARLATKAVRVGPWLRFGSPEEQLLPWPVPRDQDAASSDLGFCGPEFEGFVRTLRNFVSTEATARVQLCSTHFNAAERLLIEVICPRANTTVMRILEKAGRKPSDEIPPEEAMVQALRVPRATIQDIAESAVSKLLNATLLPNKQQLSVFVAEESEREPIVREPLLQLEDTHSDLLHIGEREALSLLSVLFLCYRGSPAIGRDKPPLKQLAQMLGALGFVYKGSRRKLRTDDVLSALRAAESRLSGYYAEETPPLEGGVWEDIEVTLAPVESYTPGQLCSVKRRCNTINLSRELEDQWYEHELSYSISLKTAATSDGALGQETRERGNDARAGKDDRATRERYLAVVLNDSAMALHWMEESGVRGDES